jgi:hypothetical protein
MLLHNTHENEAQRIVDEIWDCFQLIKFSQATYTYRRRMFFKDLKKGNIDDNDNT